VDRIVNALLYEGYILYPYRASAVKNRLRFTYGVVYPKPYAEGQPQDSSIMRTQCLAFGEDATVDIRVTFLRSVDRRTEGVTEAPAWQEASECTVTLPSRTLQSLSEAPIEHSFCFPAGCHREVQGDEVVLRKMESINGSVTAMADAMPGRATRITVEISNLTDLKSADARNRELALARSLISTHTVIEIKGGEFVSLLDTPAEFQSAAAQCRNQGTWPVLAGEPGQKDTLLSSPIILYDYPAIAPESPGELFDNCEIDEILTLRVLTMTEEEKAEARTTDARARRILDRAEQLGPEQFAKLHGTFRIPGGAS
jgi:hydrogenase maturation protease